MLGDIGDILTSFEVDLTIKLKTGTTMTDGYAEEDFATSVSFKGVILPMSTFVASQPGMREKGDSILYVRLSQENCPAISIEDIVTDSNGNEWKVTREGDYEAMGTIKLFFVQKVTS